MFGVLPWSGEPDVEQPHHTEGNYSAAVHGATLARNETAFREKILQQGASAPESGGTTGSPVSLGPVSTERAAGLLDAAVAL